MSSGRRVAAANGSRADTIVRLSHGARAVIVACRPHQWIKNVLVLAAPAAAGVLFDPR
jgi:decaprenyl-phosphate phosphoribosyltransferase